MAIPLHAQAPTDTIVPETRRVDGKVQLGRRSGAVPVGGLWVVVHRIGHDQSGPLDSVRTSASGRYDIRYRASGDESAMYIAVASYHGIAYITSPLRVQRVTGDDAQIMVFDTTSPPFPIRVAGRHFVVTNPGENGTRRVVEVYELMNDSTLTVIGTETKPVWRVPLPSDARNFQLNPAGDITAGSVSKVGDALAIFAPISPGIRQLSFTYTLPAKAFPLTVPVVDSVELLEVLVQEPDAVVVGPGLSEVAPVTQEGGVFRRLLAQGVKPNSAVRLTMPQPTTGFAKKTVSMIAAALALVMALVLGVVIIRRRAPAPTRAPVDLAEKLIREIAALDADFERRASPTDGERAAFTSQRAALKSRLNAALAAGEGRT